MFWRAIVDVVDGWRKNKTLKEHSLIRDVNYCTAVSFLKSNIRGQRILNILKNLNDEQQSKILEEGGLASSYVTGN